MDISALRLQQIVRQLPLQHLNEVMNFAEFLSLKTKKEELQNLKNLPRKKRLEIPVIKNVKFTGDPLLRRENLYDEWGR